MHTRTELLVKKEGIDKLKNAHVLVVGLGGVGGYCAEQLCRAGIGNLTIVDGDTVSVTNINRQIIATNDTVGQLKAKVFEERLHAINPQCNITTIAEFIRDDRMIEILKDKNYDYVVDAIDTLSPKVFLIYHCVQMGLKLVPKMTYLFFFKAILCNVFYSLDCGKRRGCENCLRSLIPGAAL